MPGVELPDGTLGGVTIALDGQTGQLDQSNEEKAAVIWIYENCEAEREAITEQLRPRTLMERLTPWRE